MVLSAMAETGRLDAREVARQWVDDFAVALDECGSGNLESVFSGDGWWRDFLAFTWDFRTWRGVPAMEQAVATRVGALKPNQFRLSDTPAVRVAEFEGRQNILAFLDF